MSSLVAFVAELRERRIFRILVSYLAAGWVALEVVDQFVDRDILPAVVYNLTLLWYAFGIPAALIVGWFHGERGDQRAPRIEVISLLALTVACLGLSGSTVSSYRAARLAAAAAENGLNTRRVAVLYFRDLTRGGELKPLADGLTEGLIAELSRVWTLDVVSSNGVAQFRDSDVPFDSIGRALAAGTLVDGSVERIGDRVRVTVRLVEGNSGADLGSRTEFQRPARDLFAVADELARETSRILRDHLGEEVRLREMRRETKSTAAWILYQRAERARKDAEQRLARHDPATAETLLRQADTLLVQAQRLDADWVEPTVQRGFIASRQARMAHGRDDALRWIQLGMQHVERALQRSTRHARALELRGTLRYMQWMHKASAGPGAQAALLQRAREDLETAVQLDPSLASAYSTLSHLRYHDDVPSAVLAAKTAYERDAYLDVADEVLWRLTLGYYDMAEFGQMRSYCEEGERRFPSDYRFAYCQILHMTTPAGRPDVGRAWRLLARQDSLAPAPIRPYWRARGEMMVSAVIARAGLPDSARATLRRVSEAASHQAERSTDLLAIEGYVHTVIGDMDRAIEVLKRYAATEPHASFEHHWRWRELRADPRFRELQTAN